MVRLTCPICHKSVQNLSSHLSRVHKMSGSERTFWFKQGKELHTHPLQLPRQCSSLPVLHSTEITPGFGQNLHRCGPFRLEHPFTCMVSGMTGCGKTTWVQKLLKNKISTITPTPQRIVWCYSIWQPAYMEMMHTIPGIEFVKGIPSHIEGDDYFDINVNNLIVIDDQMSTASNNKQVINLFTQGSHHRNLSVIYLVQNLFHQSKGNRDISLNCHYLVIFKNPRDQLQILTLAKQMYPKQTDYFLKKYEEAVSRPFGYLFIDLKTTTPDDCRLRTNVLPEEQLQTEEFSEDRVSKELIKYLKQQTLVMPPTISILQNLQDQMDRVLNETDLSLDAKARKYIQLQNDFLQYKKKLNSFFLPSQASRTSPLTTTEPSSTNVMPPSPEQTQNTASFMDIPAEQSKTISNNVEIVQPETPINPNLPSVSTHLPSGPVFHSDTSADFLTPPPSLSPLQRKERKRPRYAMKNYLDSDSHKTVGPYLKADRVRRSMRVKKRIPDPY